MDPTLTISQTELLARLGAAFAPVLLDVCLPEDIAADPWRIPTAQHVPHGAIRSWAHIHAPDRAVVLICQKGLKLSHGGAALLRANGFDARPLEGGNLAWFSADLPRLDLAYAPAPGTPWVLPVSDRPHGVVAAWVIHRWFDPAATLLWVPDTMLDDVAQRFEAHACNPLYNLAETFADRGLIHPNLHDFLRQIDDRTAAWADLLDVLPQLSSTAEGRASAARPILDAAWAAHGLTKREAA